METPFDVDEYLLIVARRVEASLEALFSSCSASGPKALWEAMRYATLSGGKRLRPALVFASYTAHGGEERELSLPTRFAVALELVHTYSLVHDDLPCMDDDDLRRGRPTVHKVYGEAVAVLVGDGLQSLAFSHLFALPGGPAEELGRMLSKDALRMVEGQALDMAGEHQRLIEAEVMELMRRKTGALLACAVAGGAVCAGASAELAYPLGQKLGLAFQIADDLLDLSGDPGKLGKRAGKDAAAGKATLPAVLGADLSRRRAEGLLAEALSSIEPLGERGSPLRALSRFVLSRGK